MNNNNINFKVCRTKESTIIEIACGLITVVAIVLSIVMLRRDSEIGKQMLAATFSIGFCTFLMLVLAYCPRTFSIPDDANARMFAVTVRFLRVLSVCLSLLMIGIVVSLFLGISKQLVTIAFNIPVVCTFVWYLIAYTKAKTKNK